MSPEFGQMKSRVERIPQESAPKAPDQFQAWADNAHDLIMSIDASHQLQETEPGVKFSQDLLKLLEPQSAINLGFLFETLRSDLMNHDFQTLDNTIIMAHETSIRELSEQFSEFSAALSKLPIPAFDKDLVQKRDELVRAFSYRASQLLGK